MRNLHKLMLHNNYIPIMIFIIMLIAFFVRLNGINFGLPYLYDPDEHLFVDRSLQMIDQSSIDPNWFGVPASLTMYVLAITYILLFLVGWMVGDYQTMQEFLQQYQHDPTIFYLSGRIGIVIFAVFSVLLVYLIARRMFDQRVGLIAALLLAVNPIHVEISRLIRPDIQMTFFILLVFWFSLNILSQRKTRDYVLAGFFLGIGIMSKYPAAVAVSIIIFAHFVTVKNIFGIRSHTKLVISGLSCFLGIFASSPLFFFSPGLVYVGLSVEARPTHLSGTGGGLLVDFFFYIDLITRYELIIGTLFLVIGVILLFRSKKKDAIILIIFPFLFIIAISALSLRWHRWVIPSIPFLLMITAYGLIETTDFIVNKINKYVAFFVVIITIIATIAPITYSVLLTGNALVSPDTRDIGRDWMLANLPINSSILIEEYSPPIPFGYFNFYGGYENDLTLLELDESDKFKVNWVIGWHIGKINADRVVSSEVEYFILTSVYERYILEPEQYPKEIENYETLLENGELIYEIKPIPGFRSGPPISVYKLNG